MRIRRWAPGTASWLAAAGFLGVAAWLLWSAVVQIGATREAAAGQGRPGTLLVEEWRCGKSCSWYGTFTGDTGGAPVRDLELRGANEDAVEVGQRVRVRDVGPFVQALNGAPEWGQAIANSMGTAFVGLLGIGLLARSASEHPIPRPSRKHHP
ncbi:hypothetical protein [Actinomadura sp. 21ATH]|uniref:hypothetical protein n=1 Tax=Actinomadura sp. 21ATH TaxID=1735444 RepID=UPI0035C0381B